MSGNVQPVIRIQADPINIAAETEALANGRTDTGAIVTFSGFCRDENGRLSGLELEHYPGMAEAEIARLAAMAAERWDLTGLVAIHRHGLVSVGENIVFIAAAAPHRHAAFEAASFLMDYLKTSAPFWKREHNADGTTGEWIAHNHNDELARQRWQTDENKK